MRRRTEKLTLAVLAFHLICNIHLQRPVQIVTQLCRELWRQDLGQKEVPIGVELIHPRCQLHWSRLGMSEVAGLWHAWWLEPARSSGQVAAATWLIYDTEIVGGRIVPRSIVAQRRLGSGSGNRADCCRIVMSAAAAAPGTVRLLADQQVVADAFEAAQR